MERTNSRRRKPVSASIDTTQNAATVAQEVSSKSLRKQLDTTGKTSSWHFGAAHYLSVFLMFVLLTSLLLTRVGGFSTIFGRGDGDTLRLKVQNEDDFKDIVLVLHPEDHACRPPRTLTFDWQITKGFRSPDGVRKEVYLINGQFPGETVEARSGDRIIVNVTNFLRDEGLAIHWHGLRMKGANDMDGAVGVTQEPIPSGGSFVYNFTIGQNEFGTFWYHGHEKTQRDDGLYGGLIVHRPSEQLSEKEVYGYDREILLLVGDWYHRPSTDVLAWYMNSRSFGNEPVPDSLLVNGKGNFACTLAVPARPVECTPQEERRDLPLLRLEGGKRYRLRLVNTGSLSGFSLSLDGASLSPFQLDGGNAINMAETQSIGIIYPGERVDAILPVGASDSQRYLNIDMDDENFKYPNHALNPTQTFPVSSDPGLVHDFPPARPELSHYNLQAAVSEATHLSVFANEPLKFVIYTTTLKLAKHRNIPMGFINHTSWSPQSESLTSLHRAQYDRNQLVPHIPLNKIGTAGADDVEVWVEIVINNLDDGGHPFHMHGYSFYVVSVFPPPAPFSSEKAPFTPGGSAMFNYNPFTTEPSDSPAGSYNLVDPILKDTIFVPQRGYVVIRFRADNEGIWMMHCHVGWHLSSGMAMSWEVG